MNNKIEFNHGFILNQCANVCFMPLYGVLSLFGKEQRIFHYSQASGEFTEKLQEGQIKKSCLCIQIIAYAAFTLLTIPCTLLGLLLKSVSLADPRLYEIYQKLWISRAYLAAENSAPHVSSSPEPSPPTSSTSVNSASSIPAEKTSTTIAMQQSDFFLLDSITLFNCLFPYLQIKDLLSIHLVSKTAYAHFNQPIPANPLPALSCRKGASFSFFNHLKSALGPFGKQRMQQLFSQGIFSHYNSYTRQISSILDQREPPYLNLKDFSALEMPCVDCLNVALPIQVEELSKVNSITADFNIPPLNVEQMSIHKYILKEVHRWWVEHRQILSKFPRMFRLHIKNSTNSCDEEILLVKYTLLTTKGEALDNQIGHEYLAFKSIEKQWYCFDSRSIKLLHRKTAIRHKHLQQFPPLFTEEGKPLRIVIKESHYKDGTLHYFMDGFVIPLFKTTVDIRQRPPTLISPTKSYTNLPVLIGHHSLEKMQTYFIQDRVKTHRYRLNDYSELLTWTTFFL